MSIRRSLLFAMIVSLVFWWLFLSSVAEAAYATPGTSPWLQAITIDYTKVPADATNFVLYVPGSAISSAANNLFSVAATANGEDVCFMSATSNQLARENVAGVFSSANRTCEFWINIPLISHTANTTIYMCYGNTAVSTTPDSNTYGKYNVWNNVTANNWAYSAVWHLTAGNADALDSTSNQYTAFKAGTLSSTPGILGPAVAGFSSSNYLRTTTKIGVTSAYTITAIGSISAVASDYTILSNSDATASYAQYSLFQQLGGLINEICKDGSNYAYWQIPNANGDGGATLTASNSYIIAATFDGTFNQSHSVIYVNGNVVSQQGWVTVGTPSTPAIGSCGYTGIGIFGSYNGLAWTGWLQEIRLINQVLPATWLATEQANQKSPSTFFTTASAPFIPTTGVLVVGGGAGGSFGGGGAGGVNFKPLLIIYSGTQTITVGGGGAGGVAFGAAGTQGGTSSVGSLLSAVGGGGGGSNGSPTGGNGGSGGGAGANGNINTGGTGTIGQGNNGGTIDSYQSYYPSGGGGGAGATGGGSLVHGGLVSGSGGVGLPVAISGSTVYYGAGGGGAGANASGTSGVGGSGNGDGNGATVALAATPGTANTGDGGGGGSSGGGNPLAPSAGGSGIVIISYPNGALATYVTGAGNTHSVGATNTVDTFITSGTWGVGAPPASTGNPLLVKMLAP